MFNQYEKYKQNSILTASAGEGILLLFEGCLKFLKQAYKAIEKNDINNSNTNLIKAQNIILELISSLNFDYEISNTLYSHYSYIYKELVEINLKKDLKRLSPIINDIEEYHRVWQEAVKKDRINKSKLIDRGMGNEQII